MSRRGRRGSTSRQTLQMSIDRKVGNESGSRLGGPCLKHFFPMDEETNEFLIDVKGGIKLLGYGEFGVEMDNGTAPHSKRLLAWSGHGGGWSNEPNTMNLYEFAGKDVLIVSAGRAVFDIPGGGGGGHLSFYIGSSGEATEVLKAQPYYTVFGGTAVVDGYNTIATLRNQQYKQLKSGQDYVFAGAKAGNFLHHWVNGARTDMADVRKATNEIQTRWANFKPNYIDVDGTWGAFKFGHGATGGTINACQPDDTTLANGSACDFTYEGHQLNVSGNREKPGTFINSLSPSEVAQDYYGAAVFCFEDGLPDDVPEAIMWMKEQWMAGNKVIWPAWNNLK